MKKFLLLIPFLLLSFVIPNTILAASNSDYILWSDMPKEVELTDTIRTITFSQPVNEASFYTDYGENQLVCGR